MEHCILCNSTDLSCILKIKVADLADIYARTQKTDISDEFCGTSEISYLKCHKCDLRFFDPPVAGSPKYYSKLSASSPSTYYLEEKSEYTFASAFITGGDIVLDVGAGAGNFSKYVKGSFTGLDFNPFAIRTANERNINVRGESIDAHLEQNAGHYTVVTCFQVLEHIPNPRMFIESCLRALRPGGLFVVSVPSEDSWVSLQENAIANMPPHHVSRWTDACLRSIGGTFQIQLKALEHEELSRAHYNPFHLCMAKRLTRQLFGWNSGSLIDLSLKAKLVNIISSKLVPLCAGAFAPSSVFPRGHSVTAIYSKAK